METKTLMWVVMAVFVGKDGNQFARSDYCLSEWAALDKEKFFKEEVGDILCLVKTYSLDSNGDLHLISSWNPNKKVVLFDTMTVSNPNSMYISSGGIVYIKTDDEKTTGWYKKEYQNSKPVYRIESNYDKDYETVFPSTLIEKNTKDDILPKITYIADIDDEGKYFDSFKELTSKFVTETISIVDDEDDEYDF